MSKRKDILFEYNAGKYDLVIQNGDFSIGSSDLQHIHHNLELQSSQLRQHPLLGVGIRNWIHGTISGVEKKIVSQNLRVDNYKPIFISYKNGELKIRL